MYAADSFTTYPLTALTLSETEPESRSLASLNDANDGAVTCRHQTMEKKGARECQKMCGCTAFLNSQSPREVLRIDTQFRAVKYIANGSCVASV